MSKYEVAEIDEIEVTLDVSMIVKTEELYFSATDIAKHFGKDARKWLNNDETKEYLKAVLDEYPILNRQDCGDLEFGNLVKTYRGRYGGTYLHNILALPFARWCSARIAVKLDRYLLEKIREEQKRKAYRLKALTGYRPMTDAIQEAHDPIKFYHFANEADMINKIITGKASKQLKEEFDTDNIRECMCAQEINALENLQRINTALIQLGHSYEDRKEQLKSVYAKKFSLEAMEEPVMLEHKED